MSDIDPSPDLQSPEEDQEQPTLIAPDDGQKKYRLKAVSLAIFAILSMGLIGVYAVDGDFNGTLGNEEKLGVEHFILSDSNIIVALKPASLVDAPIINEFMPAMNSFSEIPGFASSVLGAGGIPFEQPNLTPSELDEHISGTLSESTKEKAFAGKPYSADEFITYYNNGIWSEETAKRLLMKKFEDSFKITQDIYSRCDFLMLQFNDQNLINSIDTGTMPQGMLFIVSFKEKQNFISLLKDVLQGTLSEELPESLELELREKIDLARGETVEIDGGIAFRLVEERHLVFGTPLSIEAFLEHREKPMGSELPASIEHVWNKIDERAQYWILLGQGNVLFNKLSELSGEVPQATDERIGFIQDAAKHLDWMSFGIYADKAINMEFVAGFSDYEQTAELSDTLNSGLEETRAEGVEMLEANGPEIPEAGVQWLQQLFDPEAISITSEGDSLHINWTVREPLPPAAVIDSMLNPSTL